MLPLRSASQQVLPLLRGVELGVTGESVGAQGADQAGIVKDFVERMGG